MTDRSSDEDLVRLVGELARTLRDLESELEPPKPDDGFRLPTPRELRRFTSEVAIPGIILVLETNIRALRLLQRALELAETGERASEGTTELKRRAQDVSESTLSRLDDALGEMQRALEGRPPDDEARKLLDEARELRGEVEQRMADAEPSSEEDGEAQADAVESEESDAVEIDVDAELDAIKDELDEVSEEAERRGREGAEQGGDAGNGEPDDSEDSTDDGEGGEHSS